MQIAEGQDPLGLNLRVSARLGQQLLYCITSITYRARYYSFLPWCFQDYHRRGEVKHDVYSLREAIILREKIFALGCLAYHNGKPCEDGRLIGTNELKPFLNKYQNKAVPFSRAKYVKNVALGVYLASLRGLGLFKQPLINNSPDAEEQDILEFDELELSDLGNQLAKAFGGLINNLTVIKDLPRKKSFSKDLLSQLGMRGGLCEIRKGNPPDRKLLIDIFFNKTKLNSRSHEFRRRTLVMILTLIEKMKKAHISFNKDSFNDSIYYDQIEREDGSIQDVGHPSQLGDIVNRWKMFHFHYYLSFALESLFVSTVDKARAAGLQGFNILEAIRELGSKRVARYLGMILDCEINKSFLDMSPQELFRYAGFNIEKTDVLASRKIAEKIRINHPLSERSLSNILAEESLFFRPEGIAISLILLSVILLRYIKWEETPYGNWLGQAVDDPYKDITLPVVLHEIKSSFQDFWNTPWRVSAPRIINRFVVRLHEVLAFDKSWTGTKAFFHTDQDVIRWHNLNYDEPACGNPRLMNSVQILKDLSLIENDESHPEILCLKKDGKLLLEKELSEMQERT